MKTWTRAHARGRVRLVLQGGLRLVGWLRHRQQQRRQW